MIRQPPGQQGTFVFARPCAHSRTKLRWRLMRNGRLHLGSYCLDCWQWLRWVPQDSATLAEAPQRPGRPTTTDEEEEGVP